MQKRISARLRILILMVAVGLITACSFPLTVTVGGTATPVPATVSTSTAPPSTATRAPATNTPSVETPTFVLVTDTPVPASDTPAPPTDTPLLATPTTEPVSFDAGGSQKVFQGTISRGDRHTYTVKGEKNQLLLLNLVTKTISTIGVTGADGTVLLDPQHNWMDFETELTSTQDYTIDLISYSADPGDFTFTINLPTRLTPPTSGKSVSVSGSTLEGYPVSYVVFSSRDDQTVAVNLKLQSGLAMLEIDGFNLPITYIRPQDNPATQWSGYLEQSQDYIYTVVPKDNQVASYTLTILYR